jgi:hypothetical protein
MSPALTVIVVIGASMLSAIAGLLWVRRLVPLSFLKTHHEVAGCFIGVLCDGTSPDRMTSARCMSGWLGRAADHCLQCAPGAPRSAAFTLNKHRKYKCTKQH